MKAFKVLILVLLASFSYTVASAQVRHHKVYHKRHHHVVVHHRHHR